jgi:hypothetical protein
MRLQQHGVLQRKLAALLKNLLAVCGSGRVRAGRPDWHGYRSDRRLAWIGTGGHRCVFTYGESSGMRSANPGQHVRLAPEHLVEGDRQVAGEPEL